MDATPTEEQLHAFRQDGIGHAMIQVEKLLCELLGREWSAGGMSVDSLARELAARRAIESLSRAPAEPVAHICVLPTKDAGPKKFFTAPSDPRGFPVYRHSPGVHPTESAGPAPAGMLLVSEAALRQIARAIEGLKRECGMDPESPQAIRNAQYMSLAYAVRKLGESHEG